MSRAGSEHPAPTGDERDERSGPDQEGAVENTLRDATTTGTGEDPAPPDQPQAAAFPRRGDDADKADDEI